MTFSQALLERAQPMMDAIMVHPHSFKPSQLVPYQMTY